MSLELKRGQLFIFVKLKVNRAKQTLNPKTKAKDNEGMKEKVSGIFFLC